MKPKVFVCLPVFSLLWLLLATPAAATSYTLLA